MNSHSLKILIFIDDEEKSICWKQQLKKLFSWKIVPVTLQPINIQFEKVESDEDKALKEKQISDLKVSILRREKLLSNEAYVSKAPANIVEQDRIKLKEEKEKLKALEG